MRDRSANTPPKRRLAIRRHHKWLGLILCFFIALQCVSGLVLNHRNAWTDVNISRRFLPPHYRYDNWNQGLMRGTLASANGEVYIFGNGGVFVRNENGEVDDYNDGMPQGTDYKNVKAMAFSADSVLFAAAQYGLYRLTDGKWESANIPLEKDERISHMATCGDSLVIATRDRLFLSLPPYDKFTSISLAAPEGYDGKVSGFRIMWLLHTGELLGLPGKILVDAVGFILIFLSFSGIIIWLRKKKRIAHKVGASPFFKWNGKWHRKVGVASLLFLIFVSFTGWALRPPLLIPFALAKVAGIPGTLIDPQDAWRDKLRMIEYDKTAQDWILSTSDGMYALDNSLHQVPRKIESAPHVSVMGATVLRQQSNGNWLVGSLSGLFEWDRQAGKITDWFSGEPDDGKPRAPFGSNPVAGYTEDFGHPCAIDYYTGTDAIAQPTELDYLPMSLFGVALEIHTGRIYHIFGLAPLIWIFLFGGLITWLLISGYQISNSHRKYKSPKITEPDAASECENNHN